jgi:isopentenyl diphosphate isomerase/L-lactate dehydrogenase-like FMN-dependent dehydrogenase
MAASRRDFLAGSATAMAAAGAASAAGAPATSGPGTPSAVQPVRVVNLRELEARAEAVIPPGAFSFIAGASGDEWTKAENEAAFSRIRMAPNYLNGLTTVDTSTTLFGTKLATPIIIPPMGNQGLAHTSAEGGTAAGAASEEVLMSVSQSSNLSLEEVQAAGSGPKWIQLYMPADKGVAREYLARAKAAGYLAVLFTIDTVGETASERSVRAGFIPGRSRHGNFPTPQAMNRGPDWSDVEFVQKNSGGMPVLIKGVLTEGLVKRAVSAGLQGIQVSNHGGRGLDGSPASISVLPRLAQAADGKLTIVLDSGVRRGQDVFRALALGAHAVGVGRPVFYGLGLGGSMGVQAVLAKIKNEFAGVMQASGTATVAQINRSFIFPAEG